MRRKIDGILLLDKPANSTSNRILQEVKRFFNAEKAGHTGSLDPIATGMLPVCFGQATKFSQFLLDADKHYDVVAKLGEITTTGDCEGEVIARHSTKEISFEQIKTVVLKFLGDLEQTPPMFSAIKHHGQPLYKLARQGINVERMARKIHIFAIHVESFENNLCRFQVHCSKGTYIRTLIEDIGLALGCGAHVLELRRLKVSSYHQTEMYTMNMLKNILETSGDNALLSCLLPVESALQIFPAIKLSQSAIFYLKTGQAVRASGHFDPSVVRLFTEDEKFLGVGEMMPDGRVKPCRLMTEN